MPGVCFCCLSSAEKVHMVVTNFGALQRLDQITGSEAPQFLCGRILLIENQVLVAPISGKPCAYYEAFVEELQEKNDENGIAGVQDLDDPHKVWVQLYREAKASDFALIDPSFPDKIVYVPGSEVGISVLANEDTVTRKRLRSKLVVRNVDRQQITLDFLARGNVNIEGSKRVIRFREANFEQGEQIGVLGVIKGDDNNVKQCLAVTKQALTDEFVNSKGLSDWDRRAWEDLVEQSCIIVTDMVKYLQGVIVPELPSKQQLAKPYESSTTVETQSMSR